MRNDRELDAAEVTMPSLRALDLLDDLVELRMRDNWVKENGGNNDNLKEYLT